MNEQLKKELDLLKAEWGTPAFDARLERMNLRNELKGAEITIVCR